MAEQLLALLSETSQGGACSQSASMDRGGPEAAAKGRVAGPPWPCAHSHTHTQTDAKMHATTHKNPPTHMHASTQERALCRRFAAISGDKSWRPVFAPSVRLRFNGVSPSEALVGSGADLARRGAKTSSALVGPSPPPDPHPSTHAPARPRPSNNSERNLSAETPQGSDRAVLRFSRRANGRPEIKRAHPSETPGPDSAAQHPETQHDAAELSPTGARFRPTSTKLGLAEFWPFRPMLDELGQDFGEVGQIRTILAWPQMLTMAWQESEKFGPR